MMTTLELAWLRLQAWDKLSGFSFPTEVEIDGKKFSNRKALNFNEMQDYSDRMVAWLLSPEKADNDAN
jgi:hypothetical protein